MTSFQSSFSDPRLLGKTLPEGFYRRYLLDPDRELYFKRDGGEWRARTYRDMMQYLLRTLSGLRALGFQAGDRVCIFAENREEWMITDYAAQWLGGATTAIYTTSTVDQIHYLLAHSESKILFASKALAKSLQNLKPLPHLKAIVMWDGADKVAGFSVLSAEDFLKAPMKESEAEALLPKINSEELCCLLYTSGTTGEPKGVMLSHRNLISCLIAMARAVPGLTSEKSTISFLPLSHIYERALHNLWLQLGLRVYFAESLEKLIENVQEIRPQVMVAVPRIFEKMYTKIQEKQKNAPFAKKELFYAAMAFGKKAFPFLYAGKALPFSLKALHAFFDFLVFRKIRAITGGRAELFISGGAPLSQEIAEFFYYAGFTILEGYGLSETCILSCNMPGKLKIGSVGPAFDSVEYRIAEDGEILVRGPSVMMGYFKKPEETAEVLTKEGWFHTGDIGEIDSEGFLKITDRKKDLIVTAGGKKIAPQPIENQLKGDPLIEAVCLLGDKKKYVVALVVPSLELCRSWGDRKGVKLKDLSECAASAPLREHFLRAFEKTNADLPKYSTIKDFRILSQPFSIESGELTPTLKLKRRVIQERYRAVIEEMYPPDSD